MIEIIITTTIMIIIIIMIKFQEEEEEEEEEGKAEVVDKRGQRIVSMSGKGLAMTGGEAWDVSYGVWGVVVADRETRLQTDTETDGYWSMVAVKQKRRLKRIRREADV